MQLPQIPLGFPEYGAFTSQVTPAAPHHQRAPLGCQSLLFLLDREQKVPDLSPPCAAQGHWPYVGINTLVSKTQAIWGVDHMPPELLPGTETRSTSLYPLELYLLLYPCLDSSPSQSQCLLLFCFFLREFLRKAVFYKSSSEVLLLGNPNLR